MGIRNRLVDLGRGVVKTAATVALDWAQPQDSFFKSSGDEGSDNTTTDPKADGGGDHPTSSEDSIPDPKSMFWDPFSVVEQMGFKEKPSQVSYGTLRAMVMRMPIVNAIIQTRIRQVETMARPQHDRYSSGFRIRMRDEEQKPSAVDRKWLKKTEQLIMHTGVHDDPRHRDNFKTFLHKYVKDSLRYDQSVMEIVPDRRGIPAQWYAVDASIIRLADSASAYFRKKDREETKYVQIYDGMIVAEYTTEEMGFGVRNPDADIRLAGYGTSELETLVIAVTGLLQGWQYNQKFFSQGSSAKGVLNFKGAVNETQLKAFRRHWYAMLASVENAWRTPITNAEGLEWIKLQENNRDMEFNAWMDFLIKVVCSCYAIDPVEVNFQYGNVGQSSALNQENNQQKITESKSRGLRPLLAFVEDQLNKNIIWPMNDNFSFEFVGLDAKTQEEVQDMNVKRVKTYMTIDEIRAEDDKPPLPDGLGAVVLDSVWMQNKSAQEQQAQQEQMQAQQEVQAQQDGANGDGGDEFDQLFPDDEADDDGGDENEDGGDDNAVAKAMRGPHRIVIDI